MESWQKELKELLGAGEAKIWKGEYYGNASNPTIVYLPGNTTPLDLRRLKVKDIIATHILPDFPKVSFVAGSFASYLPYPYYGGADSYTMTEFARAINTIKNMKEDSSASDGTPDVSDTDTTPLLILVAIALVLWYIM